MNLAPIEKTPLWLRILQFPLVRLMLLGGPIFFFLLLSNHFMLRLADSPLATIGSAAAMAAVSISFYAVFVRFIERRRVSELSLPGGGREFGAGLLVGAGLYTACVLILMALGIYRIDGLNPWSYMLPAVAMALSSGVLEELLFRGVVFRIGEDALGSWISLVVSSLVFGLIHLANPAATWIGALFISVEAGVLLAAAYMATRRLWMSIGFHIAWNYTQSGIFSGIVSGGNSAPGLLKSALSGPALLTGGSFGLEASVIAFVLCTATGLTLVYAAVRRGSIVASPWTRR